MASTASEFKLIKSEDPTLKIDVIDLINQLWSQPITKRHLPCPNPSNLERKDLHLISSQKYVTSPKIDGVRMFLLLGSMANTEQEYSVFINRAYDIFPIQLPVEHQGLFDGTLLDGELTQKVDGNFRYTVFDAVAVEGYDLKVFPFTQRQAAYEGAVAALYNINGLTFVPKLWVPLEYAATVFRENQQTSDGLILQPLNGKLKAGIQPEVFKWKPVNKQSVDFYISNQNGATILECGNGPDIIDANRIHCYLETCYTEKGSFMVAQKKQVYECSLTRFEGEKLFFTVVKPRKDKQYANDARVVISTLKSIEEDISVEELVGLSQ